MQSTFQIVVCEIFLPCQAKAPPVGSLEMNTDPLPSTAAQNDAMGHEIPHSVSVPSTSDRVHLGADEVGSVDVSTPPFPSVAAQKYWLGQESDEIQLPESRYPRTHTGDEDTALDVSNICPPESPAQQIDTVMQSTESTAFVESIAFAIQFEAASGERDARTSPD